MMDISVLWKLSYGMYALGTWDKERPTGCIINTAVQVTSENPTIAISLNKDNFTYEALCQSQRFSLSVLSEKTNPNVIAKLGFSSGRVCDKFDSTLFSWEVYDELPVVLENAAGYVTASVLAVHEMETHAVILARIEQTKNGADYTPMTYKYYHEVMKGKAPKNAPTYQKEENTEKKWICGVCGYAFPGDLSMEADTFICPVCGQPKSVFKRS